MQEQMKAHKAQAAAAAVASKSSKSADGKKKRGDSDEQAESEDDDDDMPDNVVVLGELDELGRQRTFGASRPCLSR